MFRHKRLIFVMIAMIAISSLFMIVMVRHTDYQAEKGAERSQGGGVNAAADTEQMDRCGVYAGRSDANNVNLVRIGVLANRGNELCLREWKPTADYLADRLSPLQFEIVPLSFDEIFAAVKERRVSYVAANPSYYASLEYQGLAHRIATLQMPGDPCPQTLFGGVIFTRADRTDIKSLQDVRGKRFAAVDANSLGGWHAAWRELLDHGIRPETDFRELVYSGTHDDVVKAVLSGQVDAGTVRSTQLERMAKEKLLDLTQIKVIHSMGDLFPKYPYLLSTRLYPEWPIAALNNVPGDLSKKISVALLMLSEDMPAAKAMHGAGWAIPQDYAEVHSLLRVLHMPPYEKDGIVTWNQVLRQYRLSIAAIAIVVLGLVFFTGYVLRANSRINNAEAARRQSEQQYRLLTENAVNGVSVHQMIFDGQGKPVDYVFLHANPAFEEHTGLKPESIIGRRVTEVLPGIEKTSMIEIYGNVTLTGESISFEQQIEPLRRHYEISAYKVSDGQFATVFQDITDRKRAEEAFAEQQTLLSTILDAISVPVFYKDRQGMYIGCNTAFTEYIGLPREEIIGKTVFDIAPNDLAEHYQQADQEIIQGQTSQIYEGRVVNVNGSYHDVVFHKSSFRNLLGEVIGIVGAMLDITDRKRAEEVLRLTQFSIEKAADGVLWIGADARVHYVNEAVCRNLGYSKDELLAMSVCDIDPDFPVAAWPSHWQLLKREGYLQIQSRHRKKNGDIMLVELSLNYVDFEGQQYNFAYVHDITARKQAEQNLLASETRMRAITDSAQDAILMMDPEGRVSYWNPAAVRILGYTNAEAIGKNLHSFMVPTHYHQAHHAAFPSFKQTGHGGAIGKTLDLNALRKDGTEISVQLSLSAIQLNDGWHAVGILRDITARKQAEQELITTNRHLEMATAQAKELATKAEAANIAKSEFLANMSHEIRTPMNGVIGMTGLLIDTELTGEQRNYAQTIQSCGESLLILINDILDFSKIEAGKLELEMLDFDVRDMLEDFSSMLAIKAHEKGLELICASDPQVPSYLRGDSGRLRQILTNLVGNAIKFTAQGEVAVRVNRMSTTDSEVVLRFSVSDTGTGIPPEKISLMFEKFTQADASTTRKYGGTGLGLAIAKQLVEKMGGQIGVRSEVGKGSKFWFTVRLGLQSEHETKRKIPAEIFGKRILVVDDNLTNREILKVRLTSWGATVTESSDGPSALSALQQAKVNGLPFDVVITDMQMPGMDGLMLGASIRQDEQIKDVCLMMMTSLGQQSNNTQLADLGFAACMTKPVRPSELFKHLTAALTGVENTDKSHSAPQHEPVMQFRSGPVRILLAEDNITNQQVAVGLLKKLGFRVDAVANGLEAVRALEDIAYDLVLMDVQMPEMDGLEATKKIRTSKSVLNPNLPIIAMTAHAMQGDREKCLLAGMNDYISKPVSPKVLAEKLEQWLPKRQDTSTQQKDIVMDTIAKVTPVSQIPIFDKAGFLDRLMGDEEIAEKIIEVFLDDIPKQIESLKQSLDACDSETIHRIVHSIKGAAANVGGEALRELAAQVEKACKEGCFKSVSDSCPRLESQFNDLKEVMTNNKRKGTIK